MIKYKAVEKVSMLCLMVLLWNATPAMAIRPEAVRENNRAVELLKNKSNYQAYQSLLSALALEPYEARLHFNLALSFELNEEKEKAFKEYETALRLSEEGSEVRFLALFNLARLSADNKQIEAALDYYQRALEVQPDSREVRHNIELLWQGGGGGGEGDNKEDQDQQQGENKDQQKPQDQDNQDGKDKEKKPEPKKQPQKFESKDLSRDDVRKILDEINDQEQEIRAKEYDKGRKERGHDKDW